MWQVEIGPSHQPQTQLIFVVHLNVPVTFSMARLDNFSCIASEPVNIIQSSVREDSNLVQWTKWGWYFNSAGRNPAWDGDPKYKYITFVGTVTVTFGSARSIVWQTHLQQGQVCDNLTTLESEVQSINHTSLNLSDGGEVCSFHVDNTADHKSCQSAIAELSTEVAQIGLESKILPHPPRTILHIATHPPVKSIL